jgi:DNA-binding response OmpR family regulator
MVRRRVARKDIYSGPEADATVAAMSTAVLLAEPEPTTRGYLARHLTDDGFAVLGATAAGEALALAEQARPDLVLLESELGEVSGAEVCRRLRQGEPGRSWNRDVPVIVLGGSETDAVDRVRAFDRGCDDFVVRPFAYEELLARIRAVLRRSAQSKGDRLELGGLVIDRATRRVTVRGERVLLASKEYELLVKLASEPARVFTKEQLLREVWGFQSRGRTRTLDSHASRLRRKLGVEGAGPYVVNVWGVGYRLVDEWPAVS